VQSCYCFRPLPLTRFRDFSTGLIRIPSVWHVNIRIFSSAWFSNLNREGQLWHRSLLAGENRSFFMKKTAFLGRFFLVGFSDC
jgi:hypothetical protein